MWPKEKKPLSKLGGIPANAAFQGHDCYSMLTGSVGEIALYTSGGTWRECGVCCVSWGVRGPFPLFPWGPLETGAWAIHPREHRWFACRGNPGSKIFLCICFPGLNPSDGNHYSPTLPPLFVGLNKLGVLHICQPTGSPSCWSSEQQLKYKPIYLQ